MCIITNRQHPNSSIMLYNHKNEFYLMAFRDNEESVAWLTELCNTRQKHKRTRKIVKELSEMVYMMRARHTNKGKIIVNENLD